MKKCTFEQQPEVKYLGYLLGSQGFKMHLCKLETITDWPALASVKDVQLFLGFTNFYCHFIDGYTWIVLLLNALIQKDVQAMPFVLSPSATNVFTMLKHAFLSSPILHHFDPNLLRTLCTDALDFAIAGMLCQPDNDGYLYPIAYFLQKLSPAEINYEVYDKELLAIVGSFYNMHAWLIGMDIPISVVSDHKNLKYFMTLHVLNCCQAC